LVIEQTLMRSIKSTSSLTRGRGMNELQRLVWVKSLPFCCDVNRSMQDFTGFAYNTSEQQVEASDTRQKRDCKNTEQLVCFLRTRNPFCKDDTSLRSIVSGVVAHKSVNIENAGDIGQMILKSMQGKSINEYSFKRKQQATTCGNKQGTCRLIHSCSFSDCLLLPQMNSWTYKTCSSTNFAATLLLCLKPHLSQDKQINQC